MNRSWVRTVALMVLTAVAAFWYGQLDAWIPAPRNDDFWIGNLAAPWIVMPFLAGWSQRSWIASSVTGLIAIEAAVWGFYGRIFDSHFHRDSASIMFVGRFMAFAAVFGLAYGIIGLLWRRSRSWIAVIAVGAAPIVEPAWWLVRNGWLAQPVVIWVVEVVLGAVLVAAMVQSRRGRAGVEPVTA